VAQKKSRQTFEKLKREQAVREKRARKQERKEAARIAKAEGLLPPDESVEGSMPADEDGEEPVQDETAAQ
jgi:hypothetical protein